MLLNRQTEHARSRSGDFAKPSWTTSICRWVLFRGHRDDLDRLQARLAIAMTAGILRARRVDYTPALLAAVNNVTPPSNAHVERRRITGRQVESGTPPPRARKCRRLGYATLHSPRNADILEAIATVTNTFKGIPFILQGGSNNLKRCLKVRAGMVYGFCSEGTCPGTD